MLEAAAFGEWTPDLKGNILSTATNVLAVANGYAPVRAPQAITASLTGQFLGGGAFIASDGSATLISTRTDGVIGDVIASYDGTMWNGIATNLATGNRFYFAQFGDNLLIAQDGNPLASYELITQAASMPTNAPTAIDVAQVKDFVMCITDDNKLRWCQFNNSSVWTLGSNQADEQPSLWGQLRRVIGGEYSIALTDRAIVRGTYVGVEGGLDIIFQFDQISAEVGCMAAGSVCNVGRLIFFLSQRGFMLCDGQDVTPIGDEKFNRWFFDNYSREDISTIWSAIDPRRSVVVWAMPGTPGTIIAYNWVLKRATVIRTNTTGIFTGFTAGTSLDALDAIHGDLDSIPVSLDDPSLQGGSPILIIADAENQLTALTGDNLEATLKLDDIEPTGGRRSRIRALRLISDATEASAVIDARMKAGDAESNRSTGTMRSNGKLPIRANGRYNSLTVTIPAGEAWSFIQGFEIEFEPGDGR